MTRENRKGTLVDDNQDLFHCLRSIERQRMGNQRMGKT